MRATFHTALFVRAHVDESHPPSVLTMQAGRLLLTMQRLLLLLAMYPLPAVLLLAMYPFPAAASYYVPLSPRAESRLHAMGK